MNPLIESLEFRQLLCVGVPGATGDEVQAHLDAVAAVRVELATRREAIKDLAAARRQNLRELIEARRVAMREIIDSIREAKGDADARAALKARFAETRAQFKADLAEARSSLKDAMEGARSELKDTAGQLRGAAASLASDVSELKSRVDATPPDRKGALRELVAELRAIGRDGTPASDRVQEIIEQIRQVTGPRGGVLPTC
jgi:chromosome segregation ATPase